MSDLRLNTVAAATTTSWSTAIYWILFFATSVYGHVALKLAVRRAGDQAGAVSVIATGFSWWGLSAYFAWGLSCLCWMLVLSRSGLLKASSISALSYVFICAAAIAFLGDQLTSTRAIGVVLIATGIVLIR